MVVRVQRENGVQAISVPTTITVAEVRPAIFTIPQGGRGQGAILNQDFSVNPAVNPEGVGRVIHVFSAGLGITQPKVPSGQPSPTEPLAEVPVQALIDEQSATVQFSGLAPGLVGLYRVSVEIPAGVESGPEVRLMLFQNGTPSNTVNLQRPLNEGPSNDAAAWSVHQVTAPWLGRTAAAGQLFQSLTASAGPASARRSTPAFSAPAIRK